VGWRFGWCYYIAGEPAGRSVQVKIVARCPGEIAWIEVCRNNRFIYTTSPKGRDAALARQKMPGKVLVATPDGRIHHGGDPAEWPRRANLPKEVDLITAVFHRPHGYEYGSVMLYPNDARRQRDYVTQPGDGPMAFSFCTEAEFPDLVNKWRENPPPAEPTEQERRTYGAAFMPHLEPGQ
jgi:hypothetical protein